MDAPQASKRVTVSTSHHECGSFETRSKFFGNAPSRDGTYAPCFWIWVASRLPGPTEYGWSAAVGLARFRQKRTWRFHLVILGVSQTHEVSMPRPPGWESQMEAFGWQPGQGPSQELVSTADIWVQPHEAPQPQPPRAEWALSKVLTHKSWAK